MKVHNYFGKRMCDDIFYPDNYYLRVLPSTFFKIKIYFWLVLYYTAAETFIHQPPCECLLYYNISFIVTIL